MKNNHYTNAQWNEYSVCHLSVITSMQLALFKSVIPYLYGDVLDCGCGTARLAPFLANQDTVTSYTGVDCSTEMVNMARWLVQQFKHKPFNIIEDKIENIALTGFDSIVSVHSYYAWPDTERVLNHIYDLLAAEGCFILITPNPAMDMSRLLELAKQELIGHPDFAEFKRLNLLFANNLSAKFISMDKLIAETRLCGFQVLACNQDHYLGGVNFLVLQK